MGHKDTCRVAGGIMDHLRFKAIFLQYGSNETKIIIANILSNIISNEMHGARYVSVIMFLTKKRKRMTSY